jgi:fatty acid desaturase
MQAIPNEVLQRAYARRWIHVPKLVTLWGIVVALGWAATWASRHTRYGVLVGVAAGLVIGSLVRGLGSIGHDAVHGCVSKSKFWSYVIGFAGWSATLMSYTLYRTYHLDHHKIVNMPHDVDRVQVSRFTSNPRLGVALRLAIYLGAYPLYWAIQVRRYERSLPWALRLRVYVELAVIFGGVALLYPVMGPVAFFSVVVTQGLVGAFLASITSMAEHFGIEYHPDHAYSSRTYATQNRLIDFMWSGTNFHNEHHKYPGIPYYNLRRFHFESLPHLSPAVRRNVHQDFWPVIFMLWRRAVTTTLDEERQRREDDEREVDRIARSAAA